MTLGVCCTDALGWRSVRKRWAECLPLAFESVADYPPERFGNPYLRRGLRTLAKGLAMRRAVAEALRTGCDRVLVASNGEAAMIPPRWADRLAIYGDASHRQLDELYGFARPDRKNRAREHAMRRLGHAGARFLAMSRWAAWGFERDYGVLAHVLPPPLDVDLYRPGDASGGVLFVGGDFERKGGPAVIAAAEVLPNTVFDLLTPWRGAAPTNVRFHDALPPDGDDLRAVYQRSKLFVLPTLADCTPNAIVEAQACGLPVVATPVGGIEDMVTPGTGMLIPPGDANGLAEAISALLGDDARSASLGLAGRARAEAENAYPVHAARVRAALA